MNGNRQMEVHYLDTGFPYTATQSFMDFFEGLTHVPLNYTHAGMMHDQENMYWSMSMNAYKFGFSGLESTFSSPYEVLQINKVIAILRCVICQMRYKRGERQMKLPCKHIYHLECISKWLSMNKICPVCNNEVFGEESRH
ncbi:hypothetical protein REPUB_Repub12eG0216300 [Reevesia pubescens]